MTRGVARFPELLLERRTEQACTGVDHRRIAIDPKMRHALGVDHDRALVRQDRAAHAAARAERHDREALGARQLEQLADLFGALRPHDGSRPIVGQLAALQVDQGAWPEVARGNQAVGQSRADSQTGDAQPNR